VQILLGQADSVWVTTPELQDQLNKFNPRIMVLPNTLDERLLIGGRAAALVQSPFEEKRKVIGYMGTTTHDDDLLNILPALKEVCQRHREEVALEFVGVVRRPDTLEALEGLPVRMVSPRPEEIAYPLFMLWFTSRIRWDIAISPLADTRFNQCKSDIKFLDYCAIGAAGIYSRAPAYASSVRHLETGWLAENNIDAWVEALEELLCNERLRTRLVQNATRYLYSERIVARNARRWFSVLTQLPARKVSC
jgi:glycosyltransferase involved in cell wall biosynthesis